MSGIQKIIAVVLLLMSCAFVYASLDDTSQDKKRDKENADLKKSKQELEAKLETQKKESAVEIGGRDAELK